MSGKTLPALPAADYVLAVEAQPHKIGWITRDPGYTADQMREYARASLAAQKPAEAVAPDGRLHDDGYFTWNTKKHKPYERPAQLPCDFYLAAAQPQKAPQPLTVQAIKAIWSEHPDLSDPGFVLVPFVRAIERAHGIGTKPAEGAL